MKNDMSSDASLSSYPTFSEKTSSDSDKSSCVTVNHTNSTEFFGANLDYQLEQLLLNQMEYNDFANGINSEPSSSRDDSPTNSLSDLSSLFAAFMVYYLMYAFIILYGIVCFTIYSFCIVLYIFFISVVIAYFFSPFYHLIAGYWASLVFSIIQIILANPMVEYFIFFSIQTIKAFGECLTNGFSFFTNTENVRKFWIVSIHLLHNGFRCRMEKFNFHFSFKLYYYCIFVILVFLFVFGLIYLFFRYPFLLPIAGTLIFLRPTYILFRIFLPSFSYYFLILANDKKTSTYVRGEEYINKWYQKIKEYSKEIESDSTKDDSNNFLETDCVILEPQFRPLDISSDSSEKSSNSCSFSIHHRNSPDTMDIEKKYGELIEKYEKDLQKKIWIPIKFILDPKEYICLYDYTLQLYRDCSQKVKKRVYLIIFTILSFANLVFDAYRFASTLSYIFLVSIGIKLLALPVTCYFNVTTFKYYPKNKALLNIRLICSLLMVGVLISHLVLFFLSPLIFSLYRMDNLEYIQNTTSPKSAIFHQACVYNYKGLSLIDAFGLSLGPYDVERNFTIFDNQMKYFFGPEWNTTIKYEVQHIDKNTPFIIYTINDSLVVYAFRGAADNFEMSIRSHLMIDHYVLPFLQDFVPLYEFFLDQWIGDWAKWAHIIGARFFDPFDMIYSFVEPIEKIYKDKHYNENTTVVFVGVEVGGVVAKSLGMIHKKQGIGLISYPAFNDFFQHSLGFDDDDSVYVTNLFEIGGLLTKQEPDVATNIGIPSVENEEVNNIYLNFCNLAEICGYEDKFYNYCSVAKNITQKNRWIFQNGD